MILLVRTGRKRGRNGCEASGCPLPIFLNVFAVGGRVASDRGEVKCFLFLRLLLTLFTMRDEENIWTYHKIFETATVEIILFFLLPFSRKKSFFSSTFLFVTASASLSPCFYFSHHLYVISKNIPSDTIFPEVFVIVLFPSLFFPFLLW